MKYLFDSLIALVFLCGITYSQNITNILGTNGIFTIKDGTNTFVTLSQNTGILSLNRSINLSGTTNSTIGVIFKDNTRFIHNYGTANTFTGISSGNFTLTGSNNSAFGTSSLSSNTSGYFNSAFGVRSLGFNTTGTGNTAIGYTSSNYNTIGSYNTSVGQNSFYLNISGSYNTSVGSNSLYTNTTGTYNTAVGERSLLSNSTGATNSAFGASSLGGNTTGNYNTAVGFLSLSNNTTGHYNSALGPFSLTGNTTGSNNTAIGWNAQVPNGTSGNQVRIGNTDVTYAGVQVAWTITSDIRWKENILPLKPGLIFISKLNPVSYIRKNDKTQKTEYGLIAQEVEEVIKQEGIVNPGLLTITDEGMYELRYNDLIAPMIKAIQELKNENDELKNNLDKFERMHNILANEVEKISSKVAENTEVKMGEK